MPVEIQITEDKLGGFSEEARTHLKAATTEYATKLIEEANRIEAGRNSTNGRPEVTGGMVNDAQLLLGRGLVAPKKSWRSKILRVAAAVLSLVAGVMYDTAQLQEGSYLLLFILVVAVAILAVTISTLRE